MTKDGKGQIGHTDTIEHQVHSVIKRCCDVIRQHQEPDIACQFSIRYYFTINCKR